MVAQKVWPIKTVLKYYTIQSEMPFHDLFYNCKLGEFKSN